MNLAYHIKRLEAPEDSRTAAIGTPPSDAISAGDYGKGRRLIVAAEIRPKIKLSSTGRKDCPDLAAAEKIFDNWVDTLATEFEGFALGAPYLKCVYRKDEGNILFAAGKYEEAIGLYIRAMRVHMGDELELPTKVYYNEMYRSVFGCGNSYLEIVDLVACATNIAQCYIKLNNYSKV